MQSARVPMALAPTDGNTGGGVPNEAPGAGPLEVYPLDDPRRYKSLKSNRRANGNVHPRAPCRLVLPLRGLSNGLLSRPAAARRGKLVAVVAHGWDGPGRARKKASVRPLGEQTA